MYPEITTFLLVGAALFLVIRWGFRTPPPHWYVEVPTAHQLHPHELLFKVLCKPDEHGFNLLFKLVRNGQHRNKVYIEPTGENETFVFIVNNKEPLNKQLSELMVKLEELNRPKEYQSIDQILRFLFDNPPNLWLGQKRVIISKLAKVRFSKLFDFTIP